MTDVAEIKRKRELDFDGIPNDMKIMLEELANIYEYSKSQTGSNIPYPKGAYNLIGNLGTMIQRDENINSQVVYKIIEEISGLKCKSITKAIEKYLLQMKKNEANNYFKSLTKSLKAKLSPINTKRDSSQLGDVNLILLDAKDALKKYVNFNNEFIEKYQKGKGKLDYSSEENKLFVELKHLNPNLEVLGGNIRIRVEKLARSSGSESQTYQIQSVASHIVQRIKTVTQETQAVTPQAIILQTHINLCSPKKGKTFDFAPKFNYEDFYDAQEV